MRGDVLPLYLCVAMKAYPMTSLSYSVSLGATVRVLKISFVKILVEYV